MKNKVSKNISKKNSDKNSQKNSNENSKNIKKLSAKQKRLLDPFLQREIEKYKKPLPSREYILSILEKSEKKKLSFDELVTELGVKKSEYQIFEFRLKAMCRDKQIFSRKNNCYTLAKKVKDKVKKTKNNSVVKKIVTAEVSKKINKKLNSKNENSKEILSGYVKFFIAKNNQKHGFFISDDLINSENNKPLRLLLDAKQMKTLLNGDKVKVMRNGVNFDIFKNGIEVAKVIEIVEAIKPKMVGEILIKQEKIVFYPTDRRFNQKVNIVLSDKIKKISQKKSAKSRGKTTKNTAIFEFDGKPLQNHQIVEIQITERAEKNKHFQGEILQIIGNPDDANIELDIAVSQFDLPHIFSPQTLQELTLFADELTPKDYQDKQRKDLRKSPFITIDGETARDFDDAVYAETTENGYKLFVAIADVSHYVKPGMALDEDALERATSVYLPKKVIPMLPEKLSNGLCSLNPKVDRLAMVCEINLGSRGKIKDFQFYKAIFKSNARLTYAQVWDFLQCKVVNKKDNKNKDKNKNLPKLTKSVQTNILNLYNTYKALLTARKRRNAIEFQTNETEFVFNENGKIETIIAAEHNPAHSLIEECMLAANESAAKFLQKHQHDCLYRIHGSPKADKIEILKQHLHTIGLHLGSLEAEHENLPTAKDYANLVTQFKNRPDAEILQTLMLRTLPQAEYSPNNIGHFGLNYQQYTHFTSPIRRYPDLLVHRSIKAILEHKKYIPKKYKWEQLGEICSQAERRADDASRDVIAYLRCEFMKTKRNEVFHGTIVDISPQFITISLKEIFLLASVHVANLGDDYFYFNPKTLQMVGSRSGLVYSLGKKVMVKIIDINTELRNIEFRIVENKQTKE